MPRNEYLACATQVPAHDRTGAALGRNSPLNGPAQALNFASLNCICSEVGSNPARAHADYANAGRFEFQACGFADRIKGMFRCRVGAHVRHRQVSHKARDIDDRAVALRSE